MACLKNCLLIGCCTVFMITALPAQEVTVLEHQTEFKTYPYGDPDPVPKPGTMYPYFRFDGYTAIPVQKKWNVIEIENDHIHVTIMPEIGGKLWGAIEKSTGDEFLYYNHVVKFRDVSMRGPWTSGGLEYNFGSIGHAPSCATPIDHVIRENADGSISCIVGAMDLASRTRWNVEIIVYPGRAAIETKASWFNPTPIPTSYYHWMNAAAKASGNLEFLYPGNAYVGHGGTPGNWPVEDNREIYFYEKNDFGTYKSYHVINSIADFFGGYWHDDDFGFGHQSAYHDKPGKKLWIWGLSRQGMIWENLLTDTDGQYIEFQSGKLFNQAAGSSSFSPFKHREFQAHDADVMHEQWFPLVKTGGMVAVSDKAVLNIEPMVNGIHLRISALEALHDTVVILAKEQTLMRELVQLKPLELKHLEWTGDIPRAWTLKIGNHLLYRHDGESENVVKRPVEAHQDFSWNSTYGIYTKGLELEKQRHYEQAMKAYLECLALNPGFSPALNRMALGHYRRMEYQQALEYCRQSLAIDTYDPMANYLYGLVNRKLGHRSDVISGLSIASAAVEFRSAAHTELARLYLSESQYKNAITFAELAIAFNANNLTAHELLAMACRKTGDYGRASEVLQSIKDLDATNHFVIFEAILWGTVDKKTAIASIRNELPHESFLEVAMGYLNVGFTSDARSVLEIAPDHPVVNLWLSQLIPEHQQEYLRKVESASAHLVFPFRDETAELLEKIIQEQNHWTLNYYLALIYWNKGRIEDAKRLFQDCRNVEFVPFFLAKARLFHENPAIREEALNQAHGIEPDNWRVALALFNEHFSKAEYERALKYLDVPIRNHPENAALGLSYARCLIRLEEYESSIAFLESFNVLPFEGATSGRDLYHEACLKYTLKKLESEDFYGCLEYAKKALLWPEHLGAGRPYHVDERMEYYLIGHAFLKIGESDSARVYFEKTGHFSGGEETTDNYNLLFQLMALDQLDMDEERDALLNKRIGPHPDHPYLQWVKAAYEGRPEASAIRDKIMKEISGEWPGVGTYGNETYRMAARMWQVIQIH